MGRQACWGRNIPEDRKILALLAVTANLALPASPRRWMPTCWVTTAWQRPSVPARPHPRLPDSCGKSPAAHHFLWSCLQNLKLDLLPCVSQGCAHTCAALRIKWETPQADGNRLGTVRAWGRPKLGFDHFTLAREGQLPPPLASAAGFPSAHPAPPPPSMPALNNAQTWWILLNCEF